MFSAVTQFFTPQHLHWCHRVKFKNKYRTYRRLHHRRHRPDIGQCLKYLRNYKYKAKIEINRRNT